MYFSYGLLETVVLLDLDLRLSKVNELFNNYSKKIEKIVHNRYLTTWSTYLLHFGSISYYVKCY